jgi:integrase
MYLKGTERYAPPEHVIFVKEGGMRLLLTDRFCERAKPAQGQPQTDYFDEQVSGLALRVAEGHKAWTFHFTSPGGKRARLTFGSYPATSLGAARTRATEAKALVEAGKDPRSVEAETFQGICEEYLRREGKRLRSLDWRKGVLDRHVYPTLGHRPIAEIQRSEIVRLLDKIEDRSGPTMADRTLAVVRKIMNWHASRSDDFRSPIVKGMARTKPSELARERVLTDDELRKIWANGNGVFGRFIRFLLLTGARRNEASEMTWAEIVGDDWILPAARNKTKVDLVRPLSKAAQDILRIPKQGEFVFSTDGATPISGFSKFKVALDKASGTQGWTLHDLRRTARSLMSRAGVPSDHAERCLGHVIGGVRGVYDRHEYHAEKARAFEMLAAEIDRITSGDSAKVIAMGKGKR